MRLPRCIKYDSEAREAREAIETESLDSALEGMRGRESAYAGWEDNAADGREVVQGQRTEARKRLMINGC